MDHKIGPVMSAEAVKNEAAPVKKWVSFDDEDKHNNGPSTVEQPASPLRQNGGGDYSGAVIPTEPVQVSLDRSITRPVSPPPSDAVVVVDLHDHNGTANNSSGIIRQGFANGDIIVTLLPVNTKFPWVTPAQFRPELVPEELMAQGLTLTVEDYVQIMELLTNDFRFTIYNVCYKRVLVVWIVSAFIVLLALLFSGLTGLLLFGLGILWLVLNAAAIFLCMWIKIKLNHNLERCMANVNKHLIRHKIILGLDDRGKISCHKVNLCFIYFDTTDCVKKLQDVIEREEAAGRILNREETREEKQKREQFQNKMDIEDQDYVIQGAQTTRVSRKQLQNQFKRSWDLADEYFYSILEIINNKARGEQLLLRYLQRWCKDYLRRRLDWTLDEDLANPSCPLHLSTALCPCQHIELYLASKPIKDRGDCCPCWTDWLRERGIS